MSELPRILLLLLLIGAAVAGLGSIAAWYLQETRRIHRALKHVLQAHPDAAVVAQGRGRGAGFSFATDRCAVAWDTGAWCLVYRIDELMGAELIIDGQVVARAFRGEPRRALEQLVNQASRVTLRLIFDDVHHPDFDLDLWLAGDELRRRGQASPLDAVQEANRWMARAEAILRRPLAPKAPPANIAQPLHEDPPWEDPGDEAIT